MHQKLNFKGRFISELITEEYICSLFNFNGKYEQNSWKTNVECEFCNSIGFEEDFSQILVSSQLSTLRYHREYNLTDLSQKENIYLQIGNILFFILTLKSNFVSF